MQIIKPALGAKRSPLTSRFVARRFLATCAWALALAAVSPRPLSAQAIAPAFVPHPLAVFQYTASQPENTAEWLYGINASLELKSRHLVGIRADAYGQHWNISDRRYFAGAGPELAFPLRRAKFHAEAMAGGGRYRQFQDPPYTGNPVYCFAVRAGGGLDYRMSQHWMLRAVEVNTTRFFASTGFKTLELGQGIGFVF